jgi:hypothetical protein
VSSAITDAMQAVVDTVEGAVIDRTPVNTGALRSSIYAQVYGTPGAADFYGKVATGIVYGYAVEEGLLPGHGISEAGMNELEYWVTRKLGIAPPDSRNVAHQIALAIKRRGTRGKHMFRDGLEASRAKITKYWNDLPTRISERIE